LIERSGERIAQVNLAERLIVDEEMSTRGYQLTRNPSFLGPYRKAQEPLKILFETFLKGPATDPRQRKAILELREQQNAWRTEFAEPLIANVRTPGDAVDVVTVLDGRRQMDLIRAQIAGILQRAEDRRSARIALWQKQVRWIVLALFTLAAIAGISIGLFVRHRMQALSEAYGSSLEATKLKMDEAFRSEQQLRTTLISIGDGVITCDAEGKVEIINSADEQLTGWTSSEALGKDLGDVFHIVNEHTRGIVESPVERVRRENRAVGLTNHTVLIRKDGTEIHIADSGAPIRAQDGSLYGIVMVFRDITPQRQMQQAMLSNERLAVAGHWEWRIQRIHRNGAEGSGEGSRD
jgi:PAS domain S-box-containing protein